VQRHQPRPDHPMPAVHPRGDHRQLALHL
jgi:hypothetical protein